MATNLEVPYREIAGSLSELDDALGRLDERLSISPVAQGLRVRLDFAEVAAIALSGGDLIDSDDLLLHDAQMDARPPTYELAQARRIYLAARMRAGTGDPHDHLTRKGLRRLAGLPGVEDGRERPSGTRAEIEALLALAAELEGEIREEADKPQGPPPPDDLQTSTLSLEEEAEGSFREWQALRDEQARSLTPSLAAILLQAAWVKDPPLPRHAWLASIIPALELRARGRSKHLLLPVEIGTRKAQRDRRGKQGTIWEAGLPALLAAVQDTDARHRRLLLAHERLQKLAEGRRGDSHIMAAGELAIARPLITLKMVAAHCGVSDRAAQNLVSELSGLLVEVSGRQRYRAWKLQ